MQNDCINIHKTKTNIGSKLKKYDWESEYLTKYVFWEQGVTFHPPYKKLRPRNFDKGKMNTRGAETGTIPIKIWITAGRALESTEQ